MVAQRDTQSVAAALELRITSGPLPTGCFDIQTVVVKKGPQAYKTATLWLFGNQTTGEIKRRELRVQSWAVKSDGPGFAFDEKPENTWYCEQNEVAAFAAFLNGQLEEAGVYHRISNDSPLASVVEKVQAGEADASQLVQIAQALADAPNSAEVLAHHEASRVLLDGIQTARQRDVIARLKAAVSDPSTGENVLQGILADGWWMFGGRFIAKASRRSLTVLDQLDIPLIRADGALHVVELKTANIGDLVIKYRNHHVVGPQVNEAVGQVANYLRELDEHRHVIKGALGIECRRAFATVVIGHPQYAEKVDAKDIAETLRTYNAHLSRIEVITYADLIQGAESALTLGAEAPEPEEPQLEPEGPPF
ncbi:Shedu anti-phage system protein SduA domain-containing protein [Solihabitans fulvus]|nr:Shedu anti-phage system protein SduA domain-containing protein [Solihabitans fulvus]